MAQLLYLTYIQTTVVPSGIQDNQLINDSFLIIITMEILENHLSIYYNTLLRELFGQNSLKITPVGETKPTWKVWFFLD